MTTKEKNDLKPFATRLAESAIEDLKMSALVHKKTVTFLIGEAVSMILKKYPPKK
jgi:hypothetical protein